LGYIKTEGVNLTKVQQDPENVEEKKYLLVRKLQGFIVAKVTIFYLSLLSVDIIK